jgi:hypothetical protein
MEVTSNVCHDTTLIWLPLVAQILHFQQLGNTEVLGCDLERQTRVSVYI